jgi:hypothetical protein
MPEEYKPALGPMDGSNGRALLLDVRGLGRFQTTSLLVEFHDDPNLEQSTSLRS